MQLSPSTRVGPGRVLLSTPAYEGGARLSPDGEWVIYVSNESGRNEIYLRPIWVRIGGGKCRPVEVRRRSGIPTGRRSCIDGDRFMSVDVTTSPGVSLSQPRALFEHRYAFGSGITIPNFDMSRDGQRFLVIRGEASAGRLHVVMNWFADLARRAPTSGR